MLFHSVAENVAERICCRNWCRAGQKSVGEKSEVLIWPLDLSRRYEILMV